MKNIANVKKEFYSIEGLKVKSILESSSNSIDVEFSFDSYVRINGACYLLNHCIKMEIPVAYPKKLPIIYELGEKTIKNFPHINPDSKGTFCLGTEIDIRRKLKPNYSLKEYVSLIAEFLGIYMYFDEYGVFPFGERDHGGIGIIEAYQEIFCVHSEQQVLNLMKIDKLNNRYRNKKCPCNSSKKFKKCHWNIMNTIIKDSLQYDQMKKDYKYLRKSIST